MTIEARTLCLECGHDLGPPAADLAPLCERCAEDRVTMARLTGGWLRERAREERIVRLDESSEFVLLSALEILRAIEAVHPSTVGDLLVPLLALVRREFARGGPSSRALAAAVQTNAQAFARRHLASESFAELERLRGRLVRTERALQNSETRAAMAKELADLRFKNLADDVRKAQPN